MPGEWGAQGEEGSLPPLAKVAAEPLHKLLGNRTVVLDFFVGLSIAGPPLGEVGQRRQALAADAGSGGFGRPGGAMPQSHLASPLKTAKLAEELLPPLEQQSLDFGFVAQGKPVPHRQHADAAMDRLQGPACTIGRDGRVRCVD